MVCVQLAAGSEEELCGREGGRKDGRVDIPEVRNLCVAWQVVSLRHLCQEQHRAGPPFSETHLM